MPNEDPVMKGDKEESSLGCLLLITREGGWGEWSLSQDALLGPSYYHRQVVVQTFNLSEQTVYTKQHIPPIGLHEV